MKAIALWICAAGSVLGTAQVHAADWPQYLGIGRDGKSAETGWNTDWGKKEPARLWEAEVGIGCASFAVAGENAITSGNSGDKDRVQCFDAGTGELKWTHTYDEPLDPKYYDGGTSATPLIEGDRVYTLSRTGKLFCLALETGKVVWDKDFEADLDGRKPEWGWAATPLVVGDRLIIDPGAKRGSVVALNKKSGKVLWKSGDGVPGYASPVIYPSKQGQAVAFFQGELFSGFRIEDGKPLFRVAWETDYDVNASIPLYKDGKFFISSGYKKGAGGIDVSSDRPKILWTDKKLLLQFQNGILQGDQILAVFGDNSTRAALKALDIKTGDVKWSKKMSGKRGTIIAVGGHLLVLSEKGELILGKIDPGGFQEISAVQVLSKLCWAAPAFSDGRIFIRNNKGQAVCLDVR